MKTMEKKINEEGDFFNPVSFIEGNRAFRRIAEEIRDLLKAYGYEELKTLNEKQAAINFVYQCVFFGAGEDGVQILKNKFLHNKNIKPGIADKFFAEQNLPKVDAKSKDKELNFASTMAMYNDTIHYYGGHVRHLGHYFRNIYQAVKYVDEQDFLTEKQKYDYITILRAQMSVFEQEVFFYNSLSDLGDVWEWKHLKGREYPDDNEKKNVFNKLWITKYDFVRNIFNSKGVLSTGVNIKDFYPLLNLEREDEFERIGAIPFHKDEKINTQKICRFCFNKNYIEYYKDDKNELKKAEQEIRNTFKYSNSRLNCYLHNECETNKIITKLPEPDGEESL